MTTPAFCPPCRQPLDPVLPEAGIWMHPSCEGPGPVEQPRTPAACRDCGAPVDWALTADRKRICLDKGTFEGGNLASRHKDGLRLVRFMRKGDRPWEGETRRRAHAVSCPAQRKRSMT